MATPPRRRPRNALWLPLLGSCLLACAGGPAVRRAPADATIDLSGFWNDTDSRLVSDEMIRSALSEPWVEEVMAERSRRPVVIVGRIRNLSHEHVDTRTFVKDLERAWVSSGRVRVVAAPEQRSDVRDERYDQAYHARLETAKSMGRELGADFMLVGQIHSILDADRRQTLRFYQVELELIDIETNEKAWIGQKKLKKLVSHRRARL